MKSSILLFILLLFSQNEVAAALVMENISNHLVGDSSKYKLDSIYRNTSLYSYNMSAFNEKSACFSIQTNSFLVNHVSYTPIQFISMGAGVQFLDDANAFFYLKPSLPLSKNLAIGTMYFVSKKDGKFNGSWVPQITYRHKIYEASISYFTELGWMFNLRINNKVNRWWGIEHWRNENEGYFSSLSYNWNQKNSTFGLGLQSAVGYGWGIIAPCLQYKYNIR